MADSDKKVRAKRSAVWDNFTLSPKKTHVLCNLCDAKILYGHSTSSMNKHLLGIHRNNYPGAEKSQSLITDCFSKKPKLTNSRQTQITNLIVDAVSENALPLHFTESSSFRNLMSYLVPEYKVPCYETVLNNLKEEEKKIKQALMKDMNESKYISLTTDVWTANNNIAYLALTGSFINDKWELKTPVLSMIVLDDRYTSDYLAAQIKNGVSEWQIDKKIVAVVHDNASNVLNIATKIDETWVDIPCAAHTLQLCVNAATGLNNNSSENCIARCIFAASKLVGHFNHSVLATNELYKRQLQMLVHNSPQELHSIDETNYDVETDSFNVESTEEGEGSSSNVGESSSQRQPSTSSRKIKLIQYCKTRWDSAFDMLERLMTLRWCICAVLSDQKITRRNDAKMLELKEEQWQLIDDILPILNLLKIANKVFCGEKYSTISDVLNVMHKLKTKLHVVNENDSAVIQKFKEDLIKNIENRFFKNLDFKKYPHVISMGLDPRFKHLSQFSYDKRETLYERIEKELEGLAIDNKSDEKCAVQSNSESDEEPKVSDSPLFGDDEEEMNHLSEYRMFLNKETISRNENILQWWRDNEKSFPHLASIAKKYLCIPSTSVACERFFSTAGRHVTKTRNRLKPSTNAVLLFVNKNKHFC